MKHSMLHPLVYETLKFVRQRFAFLVGSQAMLMLLVWEPHFENH